MNQDQSLTLLKVIIINPFAMANTLVFGWIFKHAKHIYMHVVLENDWKHIL